MYFPEKLLAEIISETEKDVYRMENDTLKQM
jgi:hypothetical protein